MPLVSRIGCDLPLEKNLPKPSKLSEAGSSRIPITRSRIVVKLVNDNYKDINSSSRNKNTHVYIITVILVKVVIIVIIEIIVI